MFVLCFNASDVMAIYSQSMSQTTKTSAIQISAGSKQFGLLHFASTQPSPKLWLVRRKTAASHHLLLLAFNAFIVCVCVVVGLEPPSNRFIITFSTMPMPMPNSKHLGGLEVKDRRGRFTEKSSSFHANRPIIIEGEKPLQRPRTAPELLSGRSFVQPEAAERPRPTKLLLNVSVLGRVGPIHVIISSESTVGDLIASAVRQYIKEARRPILPSSEPSSYSLHYSQFSLESLDREENLMALGTRNFLICPRKPPEDSSGGTAMSSCSGETEKAVKPGFNWLKFMDFLK